MLLFDGMPQRSDTQQYAYNCRLTPSDTGDGDGHQTHYTPVIKHTNEYGELFDGNPSLIKAQIASGDHHQTKAPPIWRCRIIGRRLCPIRERCSLNAQSNRYGEYTNRQGANDLQRPTMFAILIKHQATFRSNRKMTNLQRKIITTESSQTSASIHEGNAAGSPLENSYVAASDKRKLLHRSSFESSHATTSYKIKQAGRRQVRSLRRL